MGHAPSHEFSVVIPTLNEAENIVTSIASTRSASGSGVEVIVVDAGSTDGTGTLARRQGAKVILAPRGRGCQLNAGWRASSGKWCIFLHGDSRLPPGYVRLIHDAIASSTGVSGAASSSGTARGVSAVAARDSSPVWGCFKTIHTEFLDSFNGRLLSQGVELRTRLLRKPYGDQALFVRRDALKSLGGFKDWPLMEDVELVDRLNKLSAPAIVDAPLQTSGRRWNKLGFWQTCVINQAILASYHLGVDVHTLAQWYSKARSFAASG